MEKLTVSSLIETPIEEYSKLNKEEMTETLRQAVKMANQRIRRLEAARDKGIYSYSLDYLEDKQDTKHPRYRFSKNLTRNQMLGRLKSIKMFMDNESATIAGAREQHKIISARLRAGAKKKEKLRDFTVDEGKAIFGAYKRALEADPYFGYLYGSDQLQRLSYRLVVQNGMDEDTATDYIKATIDQKYEGKEELASAAFNGDAVSVWNRIKSEQEKKQSDDEGG